MPSINQQIQLEWKSLWDERFTDKDLAECVAVKNYHLLFVNRGTVIKATRSCKPPSLEEIIETRMKKPSAYG